MIVVVGLSHRTAPIDVREQLVLDSDGLGDFLRSLVKRPAVGEALVVSTCNRVEVVAAGRAGGAGLDQVSAACLAALAERAPEIARHLYAHTGGAAVRHLFRVAASLDSMVLGEPQILGQVKDAFERARAAGTVGSILNRTLPRAIRAAKRVRTETSIGSGQVSVPSVAVDLARQIFADLAGRPVLLVGSGEMAEAVARLLAGAGAKILVVGRTPERVEELARLVGGSPQRWSTLQANLAAADVVITSTSAPGYIIDQSMVATARRSRRGQNQFFIDLAVPRDVDPRVGEIDGEFLYNIDDLSKVVSDSLSSRSREAETAELIITRAAEGYDRWADAEQATPTIVALRARLGNVFEAELSRSFRSKLKHLSEEDRLAVTKMLDSALNRALHQPTVRLRQAALERASDAPGLMQLAESLRELFGLDRELDALDMDDDADAGDTVGADAANTADTAAEPSSPASAPAPRVLGRR